MSAGPDSSTGRSGPPGEQLSWFERHRFAVMATVQPDGPPHLSIVQQRCHDGVLDVSLTEARVKTRNLRRDPRVAVMVLPEGMSRFAVAEGRAELTDASRTPGDEVGQALAGLYESLAGPHPDWDDYLEAMVRDRRLLCRITVTRTYSGGA